MKIFNTTKEINMILRKKYGEYQSIKGLTSTKIFDSDLKFISYIKKQDMGYLLGLGKSCNCIFHNDTTRSASVFVNKQNGDYLYKCHSSKCGENPTNIIGIFMKLLDLRFSDAIEEMKKYFNVTVTGSENNAAAMEIIKNNTEIINRAAEESKDFKRVLGKDIEVLNFLFREALKSDSVSADKNSIIFSVSTRYIGQTLNKNIKTANVLAVFGYLDLIEKVPANEMTQSRLDNSRIHKNGQKIFNPITELRIRRYTNRDIERFDSFAKVFLYKHTKREFTYRNVYKKDGAFMADKLFPNHKITEIRG